VADRSKEPTKEEVMVTAGARALNDGDFVLVGVGIPQVAAMLARKTHAPNLRIALEVGVINSAPVDTPIGIADPRIWFQAEFMGSTLDVMGAMLQRGKVNVGFLGGAQIDQYGNLNSTLVVNESGNERRLVGSGGANDVASLAKETILVMRHERRRFVSKIHYLTSPGYIAGARERQKVGLPGGGPKMVITNLCVFAFDRGTGRMRVASLHQGVNPAEVVESTGFEIEVPSDPKTTPAPTSEELRLLREVIDPNHVYIGRAG
jgi:glutaconate CoA-transferase, subunit B